MHCKRALVCLFLGLATSVLAAAGDGMGGSGPISGRGGETMANPSEKLVVLWSSGDREVALKMVFMYTFNAKRNDWWPDVTLIVWGPSAKLLSEDAELQGRVKALKEAGVVLEACKACSDLYGVSEKLQGLGIDVKYMGQPLTAYLKEGRHVVTF
jgi:hypothetical protein